MKKIIFITLAIFCFNIASGQQQKYASKNQKAIKLFESAIKCFNQKYDDKALQYLANALEEDPKFTDAYLLKATIFENSRQYEKAIESYKQSLKVDSDYFPNTYFLLGKLEFHLVQYDSAKVHFEKFLTHPDIPQELAAKADLLQKSCIYAIAMMKDPVPFNPVNMGDSINTGDLETAPAITSDGMTFLFTRSKERIDDRGRKIQNNDLYVSHLINKKWAKAQPLTEINTDGNEGAPTLSADGLYLFFAACEDMPGHYAGNRKGKGSCDIFISKKAGSKFGEARNLEIPVNSGSWETQPSFSSDGRTLYFIRNVRTAEGKSNSDIFVTHIDDNSHWTVPEPLSNKINTPDDESSVFIHPDNQTLYFASDGHPGLGGLDIFMSKRQPDGSWGYPRNLGYPINTPNDENSLLVSPSGELAYFASDRAGGKGNLDLYQFELYPAARPQPVTYMKGKVFDADTKLPLLASFELIDLETAQPVIRSTSNSGNGEFLVCVPAGKNYALNVSKDGYLFYSENFELKNPKNAKDPLLKDVAMHAIKAGESVVLKNIFYDTDAYNLKEESKTELGKLVAFLNQYPKTNIEISGHTDNVGTKPYNLSLSEKRAKAVYEHLVTSGIPSSRLTFKGYGDTKPIASNEKEEGRAQNRRTEFMIVSVN